MADYTKKPRMTSSKNDCLCAETHNRIRKHERVLFIPETKKVYCTDSERYTEYVESMSKKMGGSDE